MSNIQNKLSFFEFARLIVQGDHYLEEINLYRNLDPNPCVIHDSIQDIKETTKQIKVCAVSLLPSLYDSAYQYQFIFINRSHNKML
jgi:hypothetical protein